MSRLARLTLLAYPRSFRRDFGADYLRTAADLQRYGTTGRARLAIRLVLDAATTAPAMRWETTMLRTKTTLIVAVGLAAAFSVLIGAPILALPLVAAFVALVLAARFHDRPIATEAAELARWWHVWIAAGVGCLLLGGSMLVTADDGNLGSVAWTTWIVSWLSAAVFAAIGLGLAAMRFLAHRH